MSEKDYTVKFEMFYGVHHGSFGCPTTESKIKSLTLKKENEPYAEVRKYLITSGFFPTDSGDLKAKILEISDEEKTIKNSPWVKISSLELIMVRERLRKGCEGK